MPSIGDIANDVARSLYEYRILVAVVSILLAILLAVVAQRLGWLAAARRHPRRTGSIAVAALLVALPMGWYLGSPIFIRTSLVEAGPLGAGAAKPTPAVSLPSHPAPSVVPRGPFTSRSWSSFWPRAIASSWSAS